MRAGWPERLRASSDPGRITNTDGTLPVRAALKTIVWPSGVKRALVIHCASRSCV